MAIVRWDPFREVAQLQDRLTRVIGDSYGRTREDEGFMTNGEWVPPVDIYADGDQELVLKAELPEMTLEDIDVSVDYSALTIKGEKKVFEGSKTGAIPSDRTPLRRVQPFVFTAADS